MENDTSEIEEIIEETEKEADDLAPYQCGSSPLN